MVFLILFLSFILKNDAFLIGFKSFLILFSYSFYLFYSFLMHYGCIFSQTLVELYDYSFFLCRLLSNFLFFPVYHAPYILMLFLNHCHFFLLLSVSLHSSEQIVSLEQTVLSTLVHRPVHSSATIQMQVGKYANVCSIYFQ